MANKAPDPIDLEVGAKIRMRRIMLGITQSKLASEMGITFQQIQKYESGANRIASSKLQRVSDALHVPIDYFFADIDPAMFKPVNPPIPEPFLTFLHSQEAAILNKSFKAIKSEKIRRHFLQLVRLIAATHDARDADPD